MSPQRPKSSGETMSKETKGSYTHEAWFKITKVTSSSTSEETFASAQGLTAKETIDMLRKVKKMMPE